MLPRSLVYSSEFPPVYPKTRGALDHSLGDDHVLYDRISDEQRRRGDAATPSAAPSGG
jgi:hypothetical protein